MKQATHLYAHTNSLIYGNASYWSLSGEHSAAPTSQRHIDLDIIGDTEQGYLLLISPKGLYTAEMWCASLEEAKQHAQQWFAIQTADWRDAHPLAAAS
ncbi:hypothetical protein HR45_18275 [Shewanella mangrovi]|uniref:Uncharacterized protein n=1 Tax=Shewanella mangrovi TaxID=1515746 RepID=A0A094LLW1_9GAMM|nr:hypothetical protein [Shewanella mangrovi]KFZ36113.1 hypothetical protein HR45_18275 [Shewanella mangrovi]